MNVLGRRLDRLEHAPRRDGCDRCAGVMLGVAFHTPLPMDYADRIHPVTGERLAAPLPHRCPVCGRGMIKLYDMPSRNVWDEIIRSV